MAYKPKYTKIKQTFARRDLEAIKVAPRELGSLRKKALRSLPPLPVRKPKLAPLPEKYR